MRQSKVPPTKLCDCTERIDSWSERNKFTAKERLPTIPKFAVVSKPWQLAARRLIPTALRRHFRTKQHGRQSARSIYTSALLGGQLTENSHGSVPVPNGRLRSLFVAVCATGPIQRINTAQAPPGLLPTVCLAPYVRSAPMTNASDTFIIGDRPAHHHQSSSPP